MLLVETIFDNVKTASDTSSLGNASKYKFLSVCDVYAIRFFSFSNIVYAFIPFPGSNKLLGRQLVTRHLDIYEIDDGVKRCTVVRCCMVWGTFVVFFARGPSSEIYFHTEALQLFRTT